MNYQSIFNIIALILAIVATILAFIFIVPDKRRSHLNKFGKFLHDLANFKFLILEKILKALYIFSTVFTIVFGFLMIFAVEQYYNWDYYHGGYSYSRWVGWIGLIILFVGPIVIRLLYEGAIMIILLVKNVSEINNREKARSLPENGTFAEYNNNYASPYAAPQNAYTPNTVYTPNYAATPNYNANVSANYAPGVSPVSNSNSGNNSSAQQQNRVVTNEPAVSANTDPTVPRCPHCGATKTGRFCMICGKE